jgi:(5-formylfuran-3-yl)methyl phosphate synthase
MPFWPKFFGFTPKAQRAQRNAKKILIRGSLCSLRLRGEEAIMGVRDFSRIFPMRIMISVVSADEAREALRGGARIIDVKNPAEGSLGAPFPGIIQAIKEIAAGNAQISAAIGDLPNLPGTASLAAYGAAACGADYVKAGLFGVRNESEAITLLREMKRAVRPFSTLVIAAGYADFERAGALNPIYLPQAAALAGVDGCLLDTAVKDGRSLFDFIDATMLQGLIAEAHKSSLLFGLAGALKENDLAVARQLGADVVGLRSAVCKDNQRAGPLDIARVRALANFC